MSKHFLIIFTLAFTFLSFSETKAQTFLNKGKIPKDLEISLERTVCFGTCPDYKLTIKNNGSVAFRGGRFTKIKGKRSGKITQPALKSIVTEFKKIDFFSFQDNYRSPADGCASFATDSPSEIISMRINGQSKVVNHYFGCSGVEGNVLEKLRDLGKFIDKTVNSKRWVGK
jgi:hypothetical protein